MQEFTKILQNIELIQEAQKRKDPVLNVVTLFSGMGAPEIALDKLGVKYRIVLASDIDPEAEAVYKQLHGKKLAKGNDSFIPNVYDVLDQVEPSKLNADVLIAGFSCFVAGTLVMTDKGMFPIEEIKVGDKVLTHTGTFKKVLNVMERKTDNLVFLKATGSLPTLCTPNHPYYIDKAEKAEWIAAKDIKVKDYVGFPINIKYEALTEKEIVNYSDLIKKLIFNPDFWYFVGRFTGDGFAQISPRCDRGSTSLNYRVHIACALHEKEDVCKIIEKINLPYSILPGRNVLDFQLYNKDLCLFLRECGHKAINKHIHPLLWKLNKECKESFLNGYISADGGKNITKYGVEVIKISSISSKLLYEVKVLIAELYKKSITLTQTHKAGKCIIEGRVCNQNNAYSLRFNINPKKSFYYEKDNILWNKVRKIEEVKKLTTVYNLEVEEDNSYTANGIIVHNCQAFSLSGKQYGIYSRQVKPEGSNKKFVVNIKRHLTDINGDTAITVNNDESDPLPEGLPEGTKVTISPDSDGKLAFQTLKIAQTLKPKVIILENVSTFGQADIEDEDEVPSEFITEEKEIKVIQSRLGQSGKVDTSEGGYLRLLGKIFGTIGYSFYPMYLDPTSYTNSVIRRPRIYIVGIRNDIEAGINPNKLEAFDDKMATNFGLNTTKSEKDYQKLLDKTLDYIMSSKYSHGYMSKNPRELVKGLVSKFGINRFAEATDYIFNKLVKNGSVDPRNLQLNQFQYDSNVIDKEFNDPRVIKFFKKFRNEKQPVILDVSEKSDTVDYLSTVLAEGISGYFEEYSGKFTIDNPQGELNLDFGTKPAKPRVKKEKPLVQGELDLDYGEDPLGQVVQEALGKYNNQKVDEIAIKKFKEIIAKKLLTQFLLNSYNKRNLSYIPTILKNSSIPMKVGGVGNANYFILRNKSGQFSWGYIHPAILMKLMGMYYNSSSGDDSIYQSIAKTKLANGRPISVNGIIRRIGNSMSVTVLEKLFKSLISMKAL